MNESINTGVPTSESDAPDELFIKEYKRRWAYARATRREFFCPHEKRLRRLDVLSNPITMCFGPLMLMLVLGTFIPGLAFLGKSANDPFFVAPCLAILTVSVVFFSLAYRRLDRRITEEWRHAHPASYELLTWHKTKDAHS